ncbi:MAG: acyltransferase family protein [Cyclobacteriaceae bacterium]
MTNPIEKTDRIHSLDSLRAIMMLLGVVLHSSETYNVGSSSIWPLDPNDTHIFQNFLSAIIHVFRMPVFFLVAGFFGAMLFYERSPQAMIKNRISRIVLPFVVFLLVLHPLIISALAFTSESFGITLSGIPTILAVLPEVTYHLWFLYYLILLSLFTYLLALVLRRVPGLTTRIQRSFDWLFTRRGLAIVFFTVMTFLLMVYRWDYSVPTPLSFEPKLGAFLFFLSFYLVGWLLFRSKHMLPSMMKYDWFLTITACTLYTVMFVWSSYIDDVPTGLLYAVVTWLFIFGITGLFIRYMSKYSARMRYLSDASYWVYLIHLPLTILIPGLIVDVPLPAFGKFSIVLITTSVICFATYHYLVRATFVGKFLNGRKYPI